MGLPLKIYWQVSQAISLKRIADALDKLNEEPDPKRSQSVFEEIFGKKM
jgi:hypothetical protein